MQAWEKFLHALEPEIGPETVAKWLRSLKVVDFDAGNLYLEATDSFQVSWFEEHIRPRIKKSFLNNNFNPIAVHVTAAPEDVLEAPSPKTKSKQPLPPKPSFVLTTDALEESSRMENFILGSSNKLAFDLFCSITGYQKEESFVPQLGQFNPVYLYGASGTGKTHLLMAAASLLQKKNKIVSYVKAETFTENVVSAIRGGTMQEFRKAYRLVDVLIVDDVHVLAKKNATQEEFFHTFNTLHTSGRQIILSANCQPAFLQDIEPRLVSRFEWGISLHLEKLEEKDLLKMLKQRTLSLQFPLSDDVLQFLLKTFCFNLKSLHRAIEALILRAHSSSVSKKSAAFTPAHVEQMLSDLIEKEKQQVINPQKIVQTVADFYGIKQEDIMGKSQSHECTFPRQIAMFLCRQKIKMPFTQIGQFFSRDHSTVMTSVRNIQEKLQGQDKELSSTLVMIHRNMEAQMEER